MFPSKIHKFGLIIPSKGIELIDNGNSVSLLIHDNDLFLKSVANSNNYMKTCPVCNIYQLVPCAERIQSVKQVAPKVSDYRLLLACKYCPGKPQ